MLPNYVFESPAYRALKPGPRALLFELIHKHNGHNNGKIVFSARDMTRDLNITDRETTAKYIRDLEEKGLVKATRRGGFNVKASDRRATEWELTWMPVGNNPASKDFMRWQPNDFGGTEKSSTEGGKPGRLREQSRKSANNVLFFPSSSGCL